MGPTMVNSIIGLGAQAIPQAQATYQQQNLAKPPEPPQTPHMERVLAGLHSAWDRLAGEANRLESVAERFLGSVPSDVSNSNQPAPAPGSVVEHLDTVGSRIHAMIDRLGEIRQRLERL